MSAVTSRVQNVLDAIKVAQIGPEEIIEILGQLRAKLPSLTAYHGAMNHALIDAEFSACEWIDQRDAA